MKKLFLILAAVLTVFVVFCSCNKEVSEVVTLDESPLLQDLNQINNQLSAELSSPTKSNGRGAKIALADLGGAYTGGKAGAEIGAEIGLAFGNPITGGVFGALVGALGVGAYSSFLASEIAVSTDNFDVNNYTALCEEALQKIDVADFAPEIKSKICVDQVILDNTNLNPEAKKIGKMHNVVLAELRGDIQLEKPLLTKASIQSNSLESEILYSKEMQALISSCSYKNNKLDNSLPDSVLKLFNQIFEECARDCADVSIIINKYQNIIMQSNELSEDEKNNLNLAFGTALYSINFWKE